MKENKIEKFILDLSNRWECTPQEAVDRLNSMNESEINKLIKDMAKKFQVGGSLEDKVAFGTTERPRKFNPTEINPISKREAMQKYAGFGYDKGQLKRIYNRAAEYLGKENAAKWMGAAWDQRTPDQTGYIVPTEEQNTIWRNAPAMQSGPEMPITNSDPQYIDNPRKFKFQYGGEVNGPLQPKSKLIKRLFGDKIDVDDNVGPIFDVEFHSDTLSQTSPATYFKNYEAGTDRIAQYFLPKLTSLTNKGDWTVDWAPGLAVGRQVYIDKDGSKSYNYYLQPDDLNVYGSPWGVSDTESENELAKQRWFALLKYAANQGNPDAIKIQKEVDDWHAAQAKIAAEKAEAERLAAFEARRAADAAMPRPVAPKITYGVTYNNGKTSLHKNGGIMKCLQGGKTYTECKKCGGKTPIVKNQEPAGPILPRYAKIIEGGGRNAEPRRIYYSNDKNNFKIEDGRLMSHEEVVNPWGYWNNETIKAGSQFGLKLPQVPVQYGPPVYSRYVQHPDVLNLQPADDIDHDKAAIETSEKIRKIRRK